MSVSFPLLPYVPEDEDNTFLHTLSAKNNAVFESALKAVFVSFPCEVRVMYGNVECSEPAVQCIGDILEMVGLVRGQAESRGFGGRILTLTAFAEQLREHSIPEYDRQCSLLLTRLWWMCKELEHHTNWEWDAALMDVFPRDLSLTDVGTFGLQERESFVRQLAEVMLPRKFATKERCSLVEAGLWLFALFDSNHALDVAGNG